MTLPLAIAALIVTIQGGYYNADDDLLALREAHPVLRDVISLRMVSDCMIDSAIKYLLAAYRELPYSLLNPRRILVCATEDMYYMIYHFAPISPIREWFEIEWDIYPGPRPSCTFRFMFSLDRQEGTFINIPAVTFEIRGVPNCPRCINELIRNIGRCLKEFAEIVINMRANGETFRRDRLSIPLSYMPVMSFVYFVEVEVLAMSRRLFESAKLAMHRIMQECLPNPQCPGFEHTRNA